MNSKGVMCDFNIFQQLHGQHVSWGLLLELPLETGMLVTRVRSTETCDTIQPQPSQAMIIVHLVTDACASQKIELLS